MAEAHPVGFQWVMEAKARGAKIIHIDPRFTRTSALADLFVPIRAGSDIAFLGGVINYIVGNDKYFREYVLAYTNASFLVGERFRDTEDLDGLFSGYDPDTATYDQKTWSYEGMGGSDEHAQEQHREQATPERHGTGGLAQRDPQGPDAAASALRLPDPQAALRPVHAGGRGAGLRHLAGAVPR